MSETKKRKRRMRLPNGIGSVHLINDGKSRRRPWRARVPSHIEFNEATGKAAQKYITIGYYATETEAIEALFEYRKSPYTIEASTCTFADVFALWKAKKYSNISQSGHRVYDAAYKNSAPLHDMKMRDIRTLHMERIISATTLGYQSQAHIRTLWGLLFKYAMEHDIVQKNYAEFITVKDKNPETNRTAISPEDISRLWELADSGCDSAEIALIFIATGLRASELLELEKENIDLKSRTMVAGKKTEAGKNRLIPLHRDIIPFIEKQMTQDGAYLLSHDKKGSQVQYTYSQFTKLKWNPLMKTIGADYTIHYTRHTCATLMREANIAEDIRKLILGHKNTDITNRYTHHTAKMLIEAIDTVRMRP